MERPASRWIIESRCTLPIAGEWSLETVVFGNSPFSAKKQLDELREEHKNRLSWDPEFEFRARKRSQ